jgi:hypothetical protein
LESGNSLFLFQNELQYKVRKYKSFRKQDWNFKSESTTGFRENQSGIWLHPPRTDKFKRITQLAPYPQINYPLNEGEKSDGGITMAFNWGDWSGKKTYYEIMVESVKKSPLSEDTIVTLSGIGTLENDTCSVNFLFSTKDGFYKWDYNWNDSVKFEMLLTDIN